MKVEIFESWMLSKFQPRWLRCANKSDKIFWVHLRHRTYFQLFWVMETRCFFFILLPVLDTLPGKGRPPETAKLCQRKRLAQSSRRDTTLTSQRNHGHLLDVYIYLRLTTVDKQISESSKIYENYQLFNPMNWPKPIHRIFVCLSCSRTSSWNWPAW